VTSHTSSAAHVSTPLSPGLGLTVVIPTRNRIASLERLLRDMEAQTLSRREFEVVVVDDGSVPPVSVASQVAKAPFPVRVIRRESNHGAHASRDAGLRAAHGQRVLFLDDDVTLVPDLFAEHAARHDDFACGPILYHPSAMATPYQRYQARLYAEYDMVIARTGTLSAASIPICNASGATDRFRELFDGVQRVTGALDVAGDGFDEELLNLQLEGTNELASLLTRAVVLHVDTKSLNQARQERRSRGRTEYRLMCRVPSVRTAFRSFHTLTGPFTAFRTWKPRLYWFAPQFCSWLASAMTFIADRAPAAFVPGSICYAPLAIAFWEGMFAEESSYAELRANLRKVGESGRVTC
jgi:glycosyltransferase involved in cell wall biosynthesis